MANPIRKFYALAGELIPELNRWSPTHQFIRLLQDKGKLLRNYTQNIDNVESYAGIQPERVIHCHGSWKSATCRKCKTTVPGEQIFDALRRRVVATCQSCTLPAEGLKRKRPAGALKPRKKPSSGDFDDDDDEDDDMPTPGVMKPDITFFGESLPKVFYDTVNDIDRPLVDLVIVIGTSMKVAPVSEIPHHIQHSVPSIYISRDVSLPLSCDANANAQAADQAHRVRHQPTRQLRHHRRRDLPPRGLGAQARHAARFRITAAERGGAWRS
jgi:NAD+-dependent protein deacetylase SIR2